MILIGIVISVPNLNSIIHGTHVIVDYTERTDSDLIVLPSHGRTGVSRLLLGSVAERVCRYAHCPVLVLRRRES